MLPLKGTPSYDNSTPPPPDSLGQFLNPDGLSAAGLTQRLVASPALSDAHMLDSTNSTGAGVATVTKPRLDYENVLGQEDHRTRSIWNQFGTKLRNERFCRECC